MDEVLPITSGHPDRRRLRAGGGFFVPEAVFFALGVTGLRDAGGLASAARFVPRLGIVGEETPPGLDAEVAVVDQRTKLFQQPI